MRTIDVSLSIDMKDCEGKGYKSGFEMFTENRVNAIFNLIEPNLWFYCQTNKFRFNY